MLQKRAIVRIQADYIYLQHKREEWVSRGVKSTPSPVKTTPSLRCHKFYEHSIPLPEAIKFPSLQKQTFLS